MKYLIEILAPINKQNIAFGFFIGMAIMTNAQEKQSISGKILDQNKQPVPYASIEFIHKSNKLNSDAAITDENGNYTISLVPGSYLINITAVDYKSFKQNIDIVSGISTLEPINIEQEATATNKPTRTIEGIVMTVQSKRPYRVELDKKVYDVESDVVSKGGNLQDVLTNVPSVDVDTDGSISMRGNSNVKFLIDGKPSSILGIDDSNALKSIPAEDIERIEVITNPSSKFEASGTAGILNIILKKNKKYGFNGSVSGTLGYLPNTRLNTNLSWRKGNLTYYINGGGGYNRGQFTQKNLYSLNEIPPVLTDGTITYYDQNAVYKSENKYYNVNTGFVYDFNKKTFLNLSGMLRTFSNTNNGDNIFIQNKAQNNILKDFRRDRINHSTGKDFSYQIDAGLDHKFNNKGHLLSFSASFQKNNEDRDENIKESNSENNISENKVFTISKSQTILAKLDYELPINDNNKIEAGTRFDENKNIYDYSADESQNGSPFVVLPDYTSKTTYNEKIASAYAQFRSKIGENFGYQIGLRAENTIINLSFDNFQKSKTNVDKNYINYFPTAFFSYNFDKNNQLLLNYSKRIRRPRSFFLIPFRSLSDNTNLFLGNPNLNPSYVNSFELGYSYQKKSITINPSLYYKEINNEIQIYNERKIDTNGQLAISSTPYNIGSESKYGLEINSSFDLFKWWKMMTNIELYGYQTQGQYKDMNYNGKGFSTKMKVSWTFRPDKNTNIQIQARYRGRERTESYIRQSMYSVNLGFSRAIWGGNGNIAFNVQDLFNSQAMRRITITNSFTRSGYMQFQPRQFALSFTYKFKQGNEVKLKQKKNRENNDQNDDQDIAM